MGNSCGIQHCYSTLYTTYNCFKVYISYIIDFNNQWQKLSVSSHWLEINLLWEALQEAIETAHTTSHLSPPPLNFQPKQFKLQMLLRLAVFW